MFKNIKNRKKRRKLLNKNEWIYYLNEKEMNYLNYESNIFSYLVTTVNLDPTQLTIMINVTCEISYNLLFNMHII